MLHIHTKSRPRGVVRALIGRLARLARPTRSAHAHSGTHSYVYVEVDGAQITGNIQFPISDVNEVLGLSIPQQEPEALAMIRGHRSDLEIYAAKHLTIGTAGSPWSLAFTGYRVLERKAGSYAILEYRVGDALDPIPRRFTVTYDGVIHANPHHEALVLVKTSAGFGPLRTKTEQRFVHTAEATTHEVTLPDDSPMRDVAGAFDCLAAEGKELVRRVRKRLGR